MPEDAGHKQLKKRAAAVLNGIGMRADTEVVLEFDRSGEDDASIDAVGHVQAGDLPRILLMIECKNTSEAPNKKELDGFALQLEQLDSDPASVRVRRSDSGHLSTSLVRKAEERRMLFLLGDKLSEVQKAAFRKQCKKRGFLCWDTRDLRYYERLVEGIGDSGLFELLKDLRVSEEPTTTYKFPAIEIRQDGGPAMHLTALPPSLLLRIAYVSRRATSRSGAYQRIVSGERVRAIGATVRSGKRLFPNAVILAFEEDAARFEAGQLHIKPRFCSAWLIDGQHRVYGLGGTKYARQAMDFKQARYHLPTVVFLHLKVADQSETFVKINYYQKKINPNLLCDLAGDTNDLGNHLTWPSKLAKALNAKGPLLARIRFNELDLPTTYTLASFAKFGLLESLLGYKRASNSYSGPLYALAPFNVARPFDQTANEAAFRKQARVLTTFFVLVRQRLSGASWDRGGDNVFVTNAGLNGLFLVLTRILQDYPPEKLNAILQPLGTLDVTASGFAQFPGGWKGFREIANRVIQHLNQTNAGLGLPLRPFPKKAKL